MYFLNKKKSYIYKQIVGKISLGKTFIFATIGKQVIQQFLGPYLV